MSAHPCITLPDEDKLPLLIKFASSAGINDPVHLLDREQILAVNAAMIAGRPLLVRGEPGTGKSQLARAAAKLLGRAFIKHVIDARSESRDLLWQFDAVRRLAEAQLLGALGGTWEEKETRARQELDVTRFVQPGPLWWAFDWSSASKQAAIAHLASPAQPDGGDWQKGCVVLLDEIDKAESELPNGLLEALGNREFTPFGWHQPIRSTTSLPLVIITTNEERSLPDAFLRRCLVLQLTLPKDGIGLQQFLIRRGQAHFGEQGRLELYQECARLLSHHRSAAQEKQVTPLPGQAEYLDLLRALLGLEREHDKRMALLEEIGRYTLQKNVAWDGSASDDESA
ncbi:AAA family ATPase [Candidatus Magnetaquicoccus inordinatus]|uniref:AAA family ATPase n=1 Tax=Candidatus Magnetaquicoccus inordinatus TaxID=2496818 RepID=UPI00102AB15D|nr:MoxR family ATPase [Candidatus Magnetaquicoccus inordinatus]